MSEIDSKTTNDLGVFFPKSSMRCTKAFSKFLEEFRSHTDFFFFVCQLVGKMDDSRVSAAKALLPFARDEHEKKKYLKTIEHPNVILKELQKHSGILSQNLTNGTVNSFQRYFSSIVQSAALKYPALLSSSQTVKIDEILRFTKHRDLVSLIVDKKINDLSYGGLEDMEKYIGDRLGVKMFADKSERELMRIFFEARNINVHNGAVANEIFANRVGKVDGFPYKVGKIFHLDLDDLAKLSSNAMKVAIEIDREVSAKFKIRCKTHQLWRGDAKANSKN